jgi:pyruvate dehydrogenase E1 component beta subunit
MAQRTLAESLNDALDLALAADDRVIVFGEDVGRSGGVFRVTDGLQEVHGARRVVDAPVAESGIVGTAFGMAIAGLRPVVEIQFLGFSYPAFDQVISHVARIRNRSDHRFTAPMVIRIPYGGGIGAAEHHSESSEAIYAHTPGIKVVVPATPYAGKGLMLAAIEDPDPVVFLEPKRVYRAIREEVPDHAYTLPIGEAAIVAEGSDVTLVSYGAMLREARRAADHLAAEGVSAEVIDVRTLSPLDRDTIVSSVARTGRAVVAIEAPRTASLASEIAAEISERALYSLLAPVERVTGMDVVVPLKRTEHYHLPDAARIVVAARRTLEA